jgi:hypothetical protein
MLAPKTGADLSSLDDVQPRPANRLGLGGFLTGRGGQLRSEGSTRVPKSSARQRRDADRAARLERETLTRGTQLTELPLGLSKDKPWVRKHEWRGHTVAGEAASEVTKARQVYGPTREGEPWGWVVYRLSADTDAKRVAAEQAQRARDYRRTAGDNPDGLKVVLYPTPGSDHRPGRRAALKPETELRGKVRKSAVRTYGAVCDECGTMHRGTC